MSEVTINYKDAAIATMDASGTKTLQTQGKYCEDDIEVVYDRPSAPTGTKQITLTANGTTTEDVAAYANAEITVNVQGGGAVGYDDEDIATRNYSGDIVITSEYIMSSAFAQSGITSITANAISGAGNQYDNGIGGYAFENCKSLRSVEMLNASQESSTASGIFDGCSALESVNMPKLQRGHNYLFRGCTSLPGIVLPSWRHSNTGNFQNCTSLAYADFGHEVSPMNNIPSNEFNGCSSLSILILRYSSKRGLANINVFTGTPFASNGAGGVLYVPEDLIATYQSDTNWSTILAYANNQILPIEGSIYETQYADGTPIT